LQKEKRGIKMKYEYKVIRKMSLYELQAICIEKGWYKSGNNTEYEKMLEVTRKEDITSDDVVETAIDIIAHTDELSMNDFTYVCNKILDGTHSLMIEQ
jgi:hypothetical protein